MAYPNVAGVPSYSGTFIPEHSGASASDSVP